MRVWNLASRVYAGKATGRRSTTISRKSKSLESLESRAMMAVATFQEGVAGYVGAQDTVLYSISPDVNFGTETGISPDQQDANGVRQGLVRFDNIFGNGASQIPVGSTINSATFTVTVFNDSNTAMQMSMYRMLSSWSESTATWNSFGQIGGVQASESEVLGLPPDAILFDASQGTSSFDVTTSLKAWSAGLTNNGWLIESASTNGWDFNSSEAALSNRPVLRVDYTPPSGAGQVQFLDLTPFHTEGDTGSSSAVLRVGRLGGVTGSVSVDYTISAGTANPSDFVAATATTLTFAPGETVKEIPVTINGDTSLEGSETVVVTLSNGPVAPGRGVATLSIADDDLLINEVLANVSNTIDETNREYVELTGTPGASLDGYYFVVFEGEEEENSDAGSGIADLVINLQGQTLGSNGLLVITGGEWAYQSSKSAATNQMIVPEFNVAGGLLEDSSQTYALVRSLVNPMVQGTDYDTVGFYEPNAIGPQLSIGTGVGILDQMPVGSEIVDSVGVVEGGGNDRDRVATTLGHPGVHVHQPTGLTGSSGVTSDAVTRRIGVRDPNSIGVWYNGDIPDAVVVPARYSAAPNASVVMPAGGVITPGTPNILRNFAFEVDAVSVDEVAGTVTVTVQRNDADLDASVAFATVNGTALAGLDYVASNGVLNFAIGDLAETITITLTPDSIAEGFEDFRINLSNPSTPYLVTGGVIEVTIVDGDVLVATFEDGVNGYEGTFDTYLDSALPDFEFGFGSSVRVDEEKGEGEAGDLAGSDARPLQGLLRFTDLFGSGLNQVPAGAQVFSAFLTLNVVNPGSNADVRFFQMLQDWDEATATWSDPQGIAGGAILNGVTPDGLEAMGRPDAVVTNPGAAGELNIPLNRDTIQAWANGTMPNYGWSIISDSADSWNFASSDDFLSQNPILPKLTILYTAPAGQGTFGFSQGDFSVNEGGSASVVVQRVGGSAGAASVNYQITAGTAGAADYNLAASGTIAFAPGELFKTLSIPTVNDTALERNETITLALSGAGVTIDSQRSSAVLTIRDNDFSATSPAILLSEMFINSPGNDGTHEFVEFSGTPNAGLGSLYFAIIGGDIGEGEGSSDLLVDLGTFANGSNGHTIITALNDFGYRVPSGATQIARSELDVEIVSNDTASYLLLYSPNATLLTGRFDYDWDNDGALELPTGTIIVDSIANKDNGITDQTYGPAANIINSLLNPNEYTADAVTRLSGNTTRNNASAWFHGDLLSSGDDGLVYEVPNVTRLPIAGAAMTPGEANVSAASPLVSLLSVQPNADGTVTVNFNGPVSQALLGDGSSGPAGTAITISNPDGTPNGVVNVNPVIEGLGTSTLTLRFTGSGVVGGQVPVGNYRLNFVGNSLLGNGRAVDAANNKSAVGSNFQFAYNQSNVGIPGDLNGDGGVDAADAGIMFANWSNSGEGDLNQDGIVDAADAGIMFENWTGDSVRPMTVTVFDVVTAGAVATPSALSVDEALTEAGDWLFSDDFFS